MSTKFLTISIVGMPNVGKSTLLNYLLGTKLAIVTYKPQTTRNIIKGVITKNDTQLIFLDTPGIYQSKEKISKLMMQNTCAALYQADVVIIVFDASSKHLLQDLVSCQKLVQNIEVKKILAVNKIDLIKRMHLPKILDVVSKSTIKPDKIFCLSSLKGQGVEDLMQYLMQNVKQGRWVYDKNFLTPLSKNFVASEITREALMLRLKKELPYKLIVHTQRWSDIENHINQDIVVTSQGHKKIIIGKNGSMISKITKDAIERINIVFGITCSLTLFVKVKKNLFEKLMSLD